MLFGCKSKLGVAPLKKNTHTAQCTACIKGQLIENYTHACHSCAINATETSATFKIIKINGIWFVMLNIIKRMT